MATSQKRNEKQQLRIARRALRLIAPERSCENFTSGIGECFRSGRVAAAEFLEDQACDYCIAHDALDRMAGKKGFIHVNN